MENPYGTRIFLDRRTALTRLDEHDVIVVVSPTMAHQQNDESIAHCDFFFVFCRESVGAWVMRWSGIGLVELMISLLIGSFIVLCLTQHYLLIKQQFLNVESKIEQDMDLLLITDLLRESIRMAGFTPCGNIDHLETPSRLSALEVTEKRVQTRRMSEHFDEVLAVPNDHQVVIEAQVPYASNEIILIADCFHAEVQKIQHISLRGSQQELTLYEPLHFKYHSPINLGVWIEESFDVRNKRLFYQWMMHREELTHLIQDFSVSHHLENGVEVVHTVLEVMKGEPWIVDAAVRAR